MTEKLKILVIDDDEDVRETICENLEVFGFEVSQASDGAEGMEMIQPGCPPQVIITDIVMPRQEGLETILQIKSAYPDIKVIAISGGGRMKMMDFLDAAKKLGADATLSKPFDMDELESMIRKLTG